MTKVYFLGDNHTNGTAVAYSPISWGTPRIYDVWSDPDTSGPLCSRSSGGCVDWNVVKFDNIPDLYQMVTKLNIWKRPYIGLSRYRMKPNQSLRHVMTARVVERENPRALTLDV